MPVPNISPATAVNQEEYMLRNNYTKTTVHVDFLCVKAKCAYAYGLKCVFFALAIHLIECILCHYPEDT